MKVKVILLIVSIIMILLVSCDNDDSKTKGSVTFGANYGIINCITTVTVYIDNENIGNLSIPTDTITDCGLTGNITKDLTVGYHDYVVEIRPEIGTGCTKDISGSFEIYENECTKIFIDYLTIDF